jgi:hypothetical protein
MVIIYTQNGTMIPELDISFSESWLARKQNVWTPLLPTWSRDAALLFTNIGCDMLQCCVVFKWMRDIGWFDKK